MFVRGYNPFIHTEGLTFTCKGKNRATVELDNDLCLCTADGECTHNTLLMLSRSAIFFRLDLALDSLTTNTLSSCPVKERTGHSTFTYSDLKIYKIDSNNEKDFGEFQKNLFVVAFGVEKNKFCFSFAVSQCRREMTRMRQRMK